jgi:DNA-binding SARP family transcriptional activator
VRAGRRALDRGDHDEAARGLRASLALWRGPALAGHRHEPFAQAAVARLDELRLQAVEDLLAARLAAGEGARMSAELRGLVAAHPLRERMRSLLMLALYRGGRQAEALAVMREGTRLLRDGLGLVPGPELRATERLILTHDPSLARDPAPTAPRPARGTSTARGAGVRFVRRAAWA